MKCTKVQYRNILLILLTIAISVFTAGLLSSCSSTNSEEALIELGYVHLVVYDANGGDFDSSLSGTQGTMEVRVQDNSLTIEPSGSDALNSISEPTRSGYVLQGWQVIIYDEDGNEIEGDMWDFSTDRVTSDMTLRAVWARDTILYVNAFIDGEEVNFRELTITPGTSFISRFYETDSDGEYFIRADYITRSMGTLRNGNVTYTALSFYWLDENGNRTELNAENAVFDEDATEMTLYAEVIEGQFTMVTQSTASSLTLNYNSYWYLLEDVDLGQAYPEVGNTSAHISASSWEALPTFSGVIYGNGYTISNIWVKSVVQTTSQSDIRSIFGEVTGIIEDITFENVEFTVFSRTLYSAPSSAPTMSIAFLADSVGDGASISNVTFENCKISIVNAVKEEGDIMFEYVLAEENNYYWFGDYSLSGVSGEITVEYLTDTAIRE